jgi:PleD family two-component response regulator
VDARLYASKIYENDNGAVLVIFDKKTDHDGIKRALRAENIECIKVFGGVDHSTQIEDYPLKCDVFPEDYSMYDVSCMGVHTIELKLLSIILIKCY